MATEHAYSYQFRVYATRSDQGSFVSLVQREVALSNANLIIQVIGVHAINVIRSPDPGNPCMQETPLFDAYPLMHYIELADPRR